jgi:hypothetical protein
MSADPRPHPVFDDAAIEAVIQLAARRLAHVAPEVHILVVRPNPPDEIAPRTSGWCEIGRIADVFGRCWWQILWHPERGEGRLLRHVPKARRGPLGEILRD